MITRIRIIGSILFLMLSCSAHVQAEPVQRGDRLLGLAVNETPRVDYGKALALAQEVGVSVITLPYPWDELERAPETYNPEPNFLAIANVYYPTVGVKVGLEINPIDTNNLRLPADLKELPFDDPRVIQRFKQLVDYVFAQIPDLDLLSLSIGNEVDGYLKTDADWQAYTTFFEEVSAYIRTVRPQLKIGVKGMFDGMTGTHLDHFQQLNRLTDVVMMNYYPLNAAMQLKSVKQVHRDFKDFNQLYNGREVFIMEIGCPSGKPNNSSPQIQAEYIAEFFKIWDRYAKSIQLMNFVWMHEQPKSQVKNWETYYGIEHKNFRSFLATLGLRQANGRDKPAFTELEQQSAARGW